MVDQKERKKNTTATFHWLMWMENVEILGNVKDIMTEKV